MASSLLLELCLLAAVAGSAAGSRDAVHIRDFSGARGVVAGGSGELAGAPTEVGMEYLSEGIGVEQLDNKHQEDLVNVTPPTVEVIIHGKGLEREYASLVRALSASPKGSLSAWKSSALYRTMYIGGYEAAFRAKGVGLFLTKESKGKLASSTLKLWFVDLSLQPSFVPPHIYMDGMRPKPNGMDFYKKSPRKPYTGIFELPYSKGSIDSDKSTMPVDLLKFLESKDALRLHMDMAAEINIGDGSAFWAAWVVETYRVRMSEYHAIDLNFVDEKKQVECSTVKKVISFDKCYETSQRIQYWDLDFVRESYRALHRYSMDRIRAYYSCTREGDSRLMEDFATKYTTRLAAGYWRSSKRCKAVAGSLERRGGGGCKCPGDAMSVFCGSTRVAERKFDASSIRSHEACVKGRPYCAEQACRMPDW